MKETGPSKDQNFICSKNPDENILNKIEKSSKTGEDKETLIFTFACFFTAISKV